METCDISLVKQEIVELIKTEPQNEDEFDMFGQSGIKTEDSNLVEDFKDTIIYEAKSFQTSNVEMKSPWDGFLPIKEQIKDESDTSNSVDEIVKTEFKLYDSSFGIMDSNIDHFTPVDESEIKLEQDQSTLSSDILQSNILAQTSSDSNLNIECVNENKYLPFNALHKRAEQRNLLLKRLCHELKENITIEYKTTFLNSDKTIYGQEHQGVFNESVYKTQAILDNQLTHEEFKDNIEITNISSTHPKLEGFPVSIEATKTKCNLEMYTKKAGHFYVNIGGRKCNTENCTKSALVGGHCKPHGGGRYCKTENCSKNALKGGYCFKHGGGLKCITENCTKKALERGHCMAHGGGRKCKTLNCPKIAQKAGLCSAHGGRKNCKTENCSKKALKGGNCLEHGVGEKCTTENCTMKATVGRHCYKHGARRICKFENCTKLSRKGGLCTAHGGGDKCKTDNCTKMAKLGGHCFTHGGGQKCKSENCTKKVQLGGLCKTHGRGRECKTLNCTKKALEGGYCFGHGGGKRCKIENCTKMVQKAGLCNAHGGVTKCKTENCSKYALKGGNCFEHGGGKKCKTGNCTKKAISVGHCIAHRKGKLCTI